MRKDKDLLGAIGARLDIPREALPFGFALALSGRRELTVWGCESILSYGDREIRLLLGGLPLAILGEGLLCTAFSGSALTVTGKIGTLRFEEARDET